MKRFIFAFLCALCLCFVTGCKSSPPEFNLGLTGNVVETTTHIATDFKVATTNVINSYFSADETAVYPKLTKAEYPDAYGWVYEKAVSTAASFTNQKNKGASGKSYSVNGAIYEITVIGYVEWNGIKLSVDEHWKSPDYK